MNQDELWDIVYGRLPKLADEVELRVVETSPEVFLIALAKPDLPWRERFCQSSLGTWGIKLEERGELLDLVVKDLVAQGEGRGFFVKHPLAEIEALGQEFDAAPLTPTGKRIQELETEVAQLRADLARSAKIIEAVSEAIDL